MMAMRMRFLAALLSVGLLVVGGCSAGDTPSTDAADRYTEAPADGPDATKFAFGQTVVLTDTSYQPLQLGSNDLGVPLVFKNQSSRPQTIVFINGAIDDKEQKTLGPIPPGGEASFSVSTPRSIAYHSEALPDLLGTIQVADGVQSL